MYSIVLFIVDRSFRGFFGSGESPTSAVERIFLTSSSGALPGELDMAVQLEFVSERHELVEAVARADDREGDVLTAQVMHHDVGGAHHDVDAVLRAHDADVRGEELPAAPQFGVFGTALELVRVPARYGRP